MTEPVDQAKPDGTKSELFLWSKVFAWIAAITFLVQVLRFLYTGYWKSLTVISALFDGWIFLIDVGLLRPYWVGGSWLGSPHSWMGLHAVLNTIPVVFGSIVISIALLIAAKVRNNP